LTVKSLLLALHDSSYNQPQDGLYNEMNSWVVVRTMWQRRLWPRSEECPPRLQGVRRLDRIMWPWPRITSWASLTTSRS